MGTLVFNAAGEQAAGTATGRTVLLTGAGWFLAVAVMALAGLFDTAPGERPWPVLFAVVLPAIVFSVSYLGIDAFRAWVMALDMRHLVLLHSWRMIGMGFVFLYFHDRLPALFALPAGLGDAAAAAGAVYLGIAMYEKPERVTRRRILAWNSFGLLDFAAAVSLGVLTRSGEALHSSGQVGSEIMGTFPLALIPVFAVPFFVITHLIIYIQLRRAPA